MNLIKIATRVVADQHEVPPGLVDPTERGVVLLLAGPPVAHVVLLTRLAGRAGWLCPVGGVVDIHRLLDQLLLLLLHKLMVGEVVLVVQLLLLLLLPSHLGR